MKIEKVNENQIRCTLTKADLADRQLKLSELAYGTEKAKDLFRDMMQQAAYEFGFEAEDIPLMIEAIPLSSECIILIITKVEYPEELDTRFSKFAPSSYDESDTDYDDADDDGADSPESDVLDLFRKLKDTSAASNSKEFVPLPDALNKAAAGNAKSADPDPAGRWTVCPGCTGYGPPQPAAGEAAAQTGPGRSTAQSFCSRSLRLFPVFQPRQEDCQGAAGDNHEAGGGRQ